MLKIVLFRYFDKRASKIVDQCFSNDEAFAHDIITKPALSFHNMDALQIAQDANCRSFLASKAVQRHLDDIW
jgi:hypothetical protein